MTITSSKCVALLLALIAAAATVATSLAVTTKKTPAQCAVGSSPLEPWMIGKVASSSVRNGCYARGSQQSSFSFEVLNWGVKVNGQSFSMGNSCPEEIVVAFTKLNQPATIYYTPRRDCGKKTPVQTVRVWKQRKLFVRLVNEAVKIVSEVRSVDCDREEQGAPASKGVSWKQHDRKVEKDRIATAALNYLHGVAFANFFCAAS